jgi:hypothetical protein
MRAGARRPRALLVSHAGDDHLAPVALGLAASGVEPGFLDVAGLPRAGLAAALGGGRPASFRLGSPDAPVDPADFLSTWWRRPRPVPVVPCPGDADGALAVDAWREALRGLLFTCGGRWVNDPRSQEAADRKIVQLEAARRAGLRVPRTLVASRVEEALPFLRALRGRAVVKSLSSLAGDYTRRATPGEVETRLARGPAILQERVDGVDLRVTVVGRELFCMEADARGTDHPDDVRAGSTPARPGRLPAALSRRILRLLDLLGLEYGALDLRRRDDGEHLFLEVNPAGQWLHAEQATGHPITAAVVRLLAGGPGRLPRRRSGPGPAYASGR